MNLPNLPSVSNAKLPMVYQSAKNQLAECERIDECKDWADKAEALASYAKQADDDSLHQMAVRIQARAIRRCGELLKQIQPAKNHHDAANRKESTRTGSGTSRSQAAADAGLSKRQKDTALRVANVPEPQFEREVEAAKPATVTKLAQQGTKPAPKPEPKPLLDLGGRKPEDFSRSTQAQGQVRDFAAFTKTTSPSVAVRGAFDNERAPLLRHARVILDWTSRLIDVLEKEDDCPSRAS